MKGGKSGNSVKDEIDTACKSLGKTAKIPPILDVVIKQTQGAEDDTKELVKLALNLNKTGATFDKKLNDVDANIDEAIRAVSADNFGLDPKKPDDKKKIESARKEIIRVLTSLQRGVKDASKQYDSISQTLVTVSRSRGSA